MTFNDLVTVVSQAPAFFPHFVVGLDDSSPWMIRLHVIQPIEACTLSDLEDWVLARTPLTHALEVTTACCNKTLECGGLCYLKPNHGLADGSACRCVGDADGPGTCPA